MIGFAVFILFLYFSVQSVISLLFYLYLWQIKEYRFDRLRCHFQTKTARQQIRDYLNIFKWKGIRRPLPTLKALTIFFITLALLFRSWFLFLKYLPFDFGLRVLIASVLANLIAPLLVSLAVFLFMPMTILMKKIVIQMAKSKIVKRDDLVVIGITGSYGKTSTKEFLATILQEKYQVLKTPLNWNTEIGVAKVILRSLKKEHQVFVAEMAAYKEGEIKAICQLVNPQIGVITGINNQHLALFGSLEKTMAAKYELIDSLPPNGLAIFNGDNRYCLAMAEKTIIKKKIYSLHDAQKVRVYKNKLTFHLKGVPFQLPLLGKFHLSNFLAAYWVARALKMQSRQIVRAAIRIQPLEGIMKSFIGLNKALFIDDSYSSNPTGFLAALDCLKKQSGRKIVVTPGMIELGEAGFKAHQKVAKKLARTADLVILFKKDFLLAMQEAGVNVIFEDNPEEILTVLKKEVKKGDTVLLEGRLPVILMKGLR